MKFVECLIALLECATEQECHKSIIQLGIDLGFEKTLIGITFGCPTSLADASICSNFLPQWLDIYDRKHLISIDPTVAHCISRTTPLLWEPALFASRQQKEMCEEASLYGLRSGITLPFHGARGEKGILCFAKDVRPSRRLHRDILHTLPSLAAMRDFAFEAALKFAKPRHHEAPPALTQRELECLEWCASGKTTWEVAQILGCSESTVNFHFGNLRRKFQATSRRQVIVKAISYGLLHSPLKWPQQFRESDGF
jgi:LuxR family quorum-sensing transcriptional regulator LasR